MVGGSLWHFPIKCLALFFGYFRVFLHPCKDVTDDVPCGSVLLTNLLCQPWFHMRDVCYKSTQKYPWFDICFVQLQAAENEKVRWELEKTQLQQNIEENKERMMKLESYWIEAQTLCHTVNEHLKETQSQYQALEKKYNKAKKLIKDFQQK